MGCHFLLQGIFPTQGSNPGFPYCRQTLYRLSHQGSPFISLRTLDSAQNYAGGVILKWETANKKAQKRGKHSTWKIMNRTLEFRASELKEESRENNLIWLQLGTCTARDWRFLLLLLFFCTCPWRTAKAAHILKFYWVGTVAKKESAIMNTGCVCLYGGDLVAKWCLILCNTRDYILPGPSVHGISQARILEGVTISSSRGSSRLRDWAHISCIGRWIAEPPGKR